MSTVLNNYPSHFDPDARAERLDITDPHTEALRLHLYFEQGRLYAHDYEMPATDVEHDDDGCTTCGGER